MATVVPQQPIVCMAACLAAQVCVSFFLHAFALATRKERCAACLISSWLVRNRRLSEKRDLPQLICNSWSVPCLVVLSVECWCLCVFVSRGVWPLPGQVNVADDDG